MSLDEALDHVLKAAIAIPEHESVASFEADGRVLAESLVSQLQVIELPMLQFDDYVVHLEVLGIQLCLYVL